MTTYAHHARTVPGWPALAALGAGTSLVLTAIGTFAGSGSHDALSDYLPVVGVVAVATAVVFGLVVRGAEGRSAGIRALVLAVLAVASVLVFWSGLPAVLAFGAFGCAAAAREGDGITMAAKVAGGLAALALTGAVVLAFVG